eukprot:Skav228144  [mRNA]  locus=scaffold2683:67420:70383:+ [translate_table: standard]
MSDGRLFLGGDGGSEKQVRLPTKKVGDNELNEPEIHNSWGFKLQPRLRRCPVFLAASIWKTAAKWAFAAYNNVGVDLLLDAGRLKEAADSTVSSLSGLVWKADGDCTQAENGCVETIRLVPGGVVLCRLWLNQGHEGLEEMGQKSCSQQGHPKTQWQSYYAEVGLKFNFRKVTVVLHCSCRMIEGYVEEFKEDFGLGVIGSATLRSKGKEKRLSQTAYMKVGDMLTIDLKDTVYNKKMNWFKSKIRRAQTKANHGRGALWRICLRPSDSWSFLPSTLEALAVAPTSAGVNLSPPRGENCQETTKALKSFVETVVEKPQMEQAKAAWLNVVNFSCNEKSCNSEKPWMMNELPNQNEDQNPHDAYLDMVESGRGPFSQDTPQCRKQVMNLTDLLKKQNFSSDVIYSLLTGGLDASRGKLYNIRETLKRPLSFWVGFGRQDAVDLAKNCNMTYLLHEDLPLGKALGNKSVDALSQCGPNRKGSLVASSSLSMVRYFKVAQHALYIHVNATLEAMKSGRFSTFWEFERPQISSQPPIAGIQVFSYPDAEKCDNLMPELRKSWEERGEDTSNWRLVRFLACEDLVTDEVKGQQERQPIPRGKIFRKPFEPCITVANIADKDWSQGVFLAEDKDLDKSCDQQLRFFKIAIASQPLKFDKKRQEMASDETLKKLTDAMLEGSKRFPGPKGSAFSKKNAGKWHSKVLGRLGLAGREWSLYLHGNCVTLIHDALKPLLNDDVTLTELTLNEEFLDSRAIETTIGELTHLHKNGLYKFVSRCPLDMRHTDEPENLCPHWKKDRKYFIPLVDLGNQSRFQVKLNQIRGSRWFTYDIKNPSDLENIHSEEIGALWGGGEFHPQECKRSGKEKPEKEKTKWSFWRKKGK